MLLRHEGIIANHKRIYRLYAAAKLQGRKRLKRRIALGRGEPAPVLTRLMKGGRARNIVDDFTRERLQLIT